MPEVGLTTAVPLIVVTMLLAVLPMLMLEAVVVPMFRAAAEATSIVGVSSETSALPVPEIQKLEPACWPTFWFWM